MGPAWDYNLSFGNANYCDSYLTTGWHYDFNSICSGYYPHVPFWWQKLVQDTDFDNDLQCRWQNFRQTFLNDDSINAWIDLQTTLLQDAQQRNFGKWDILGQYIDWEYYVGQTYEDEINYMKNWISGRLIWMDDNLQGICLATVLSENTANNSDLMIYPNPASTSIQLHLTNHSSTHSTTISIFNLLGEKVKEEKVTDQEVTINVSELPAGMYVVRTENKMAGKFVKE